MKVPQFPFPGVAANDVSPKPEAGDQQEQLERDIAIVRWFVNRWAQRPVASESSLGRLLDLAERIDLNAEGASVDDLDPLDAKHGLHLTAGLVRLAWAIRALHGNGGRVDRVDGSFVSKELMGEDSKEKTAERTLPGGLGTLFTAARLLQAGGGRIVAINGNLVKGHDIHWVTGHGDTVFIERKDRSFEAGLKDSMEKRSRRVVEEVRNAAKAMPREPRTAARILVVGFSHLVMPAEQEVTDLTYQTVLRNEFGEGATQLEGAPHLVLVEHLGFEAKAGGLKIDFFSPQLLRQSHVFMRRVAPFVVKALGVQGF